MTHDQKVIYKCTSPFTRLCFENVNFANVQGEAGILGLGPGGPLPFPALWLAGLPHRLREIYAACWGQSRQRWE